MMTGCITHSIHCLPLREACAFSRISSRSSTEFTPENEWLQQCHNHHPQAMECFWPSFSSKHMHDSLESSRENLFQSTVAHKCANALYEGRCSCGPRNFKYWLVQGDSVFTSQRMVNTPGRLMTCGKKHHN